MISSCGKKYKVIEITSIPEEIENRDKEKITLSNLILEYLRGCQLPYTQLELVCASSSVNDQLQAGKSFFYLIWYLVGCENIDNEFIEYKLDSQISSLICILKRMGYIFNLYNQFEEIQYKIVPLALLNRNIWLVYNTADMANHQLLTTDIPSTFDNLISMMASDIPDSMLSVLFKGNGDDVGINIQVIAKEEMLAKIIYFTFVQGLKSNYTPDSLPIKLSSFGEYSKKYRWNPEFLFPIISYREFSNMLQLPFGVRCGISNTPQRLKLPPFAPGLINGDNVKIGTVIGYEEKHLTLPLQKKVTHMSVLGISGSGKSNFLLYYLNEMYNKYGIPFLVIDPVSSEYRKLRKTLNGNRLNVFTPGSEVSPFEFNLFALSCENLTVREYKSVLKDYLRNCLNLFSPLDRLIDETIDTIFLENGWFDISKKNYFPGDSFTLNAVIETFNRVFENSSFSGNLKNIAASGKVRLNALRQFFDTEASLPLSDILSTPSVLELGKLQSAEAKSTMLLFLLNQVKIFMMDKAARSENKTDNTPKKGDRPSLILVIDEAHSILEMQEQGEGMNIAQRGVIDTINQLLLEFRKYGLNVVIADQRVSVLQDVLANTHMQVIFKQIDPQGKQVAADIISLQETEMLAEQQVGEAFVKYKDLPVPVQIQTPLYPDDDTQITDNIVNEYMTNEFWREHADLTRPFKECSYCVLKEASQICNRSIRSINSNIVTRYLKESKPTYEDLRDAALSIDNPLADDLLGKRKINKNGVIKMCLRVHLLHAAKLMGTNEKKANPPFAQCCHCYLIKSGQRCSNKLKDKCRKIISQFVKDKKPSIEELKTAALQKGDPLAMNLLKQNDPNALPWEQICMKIHLLDASKQMEKIKNTNNKEI